MPPLPDSDVGGEQESHGKKRVADDAAHSDDGDDDDDNDDDEDMDDETP